MSTLSLALLGSPIIRLESRVLTFNTRKALALLIYIAVEGGVHTRKRLSEMFWPDLDAEHGRAALRSTVQQIRTVLTPHPGTPPSVLIDRDTLCMNPSQETFLDVAVLQKTCTQIAHMPHEAVQVELEMLQTASRLFRGPFLDSFSLRDVPAFDDWTRYQRDKAHSYLQKVYARLTALLIETGALEQALDAVTRWTVFDPLDEHAY